LAETFAGGRLLIVAFEGWNDAGEAASNAVRALRDDLDVEPIADVEPEDYFDFQFNRPTVRTDEDGNRVLEWPGVTMFGPESPDDRIYLLLGTEPSRGWRTFCDEILEIATAREITGIVMLGAMLADVPHTRPISIFASSESPVLRSELGLDRSSYEGPVGILSVLAEAAQRLGIPSVSIWASVPHYVHNAPSPKATLALLDKLESLLGIPVDRGDLEEEAAAWESGIDALASDDDDMSSYIEQLEQARDTVDSPEASGEAIAQEFERYLRRRDGRGPGGHAGPAGPAGDDPWPPKA
jgi:PAC2 family